MKLDLRERWSATLPRLLVVAHDLIMVGLAWGGLHWLRYSVVADGAMPAFEVAQLVIVPVVQAQFRQVDSFDASERGEGGFGSTGRG